MMDVALREAESELSLLLDQGERQGIPDDELIAVLPWMWTHAPQISRLSAYSAEDRELLLRIADAVDRVAWERERHANS